MSSNAPHSSMRRYVIAAIAAIGCLLPAACDVAAASPGYHNDRPGQGQQGRPPQRRPQADRRQQHRREQHRPPTTARPRTAAHDDQAKAEAQGEGDPGRPGRRPGPTPATRATRPTTRRRRSVDPTVDATASAADGAARGRHENNNGLDVLARDCSKSKLHAARRLPEGARLRLDRVR